MSQVNRTKRAMIMRDELITNIPRYPDIEKKHVINTAPMIAEKPKNVKQKRYT